MTPFETRFGRVATRLAAVTAAAGLGAAGFAVPAAAQVPVPVETFLGFEGPFTAASAPQLQGFEAVFGDDFVPGDHTVSLSVSIDADDDVFAFTGGDLDGRCAVISTHTKIDCIQDAAPAAIRFEFLVAVPDAGGAGSYPYAIELAVDGEVVHTEESEVQVAPPEDTGTWAPYAHGDFTVRGVDPGTTVEVTPEFRQEDPIPATAKAVVIVFGGSEYVHGITVSGDYDNCVGEGWYLQCAITDFPDDPGTVYTTSDPAAYTLDENAPGPFEICNCAYNVYAADDAEYANLFGDLEWDEGSDNLMRLQKVDEPATEFGARSWGPIVIETGRNPIDLSVEPVNIKGTKGTETTVEVEYTNEGPGDAISHPDGPGTFLVLGSLPTGVELSDEDETDANCYERPWSWDHYLPALDPEVLEDLDFACFFINMESGETRTLELQVEITKNAPASDGTLAVVLQDGIMPDGDMSNNIATFSLNAKGDGNGNLPNTGASLGLVIGIAALVLVAGAVLLVLTARKRKAAPDGAAEE
jgi:LPXTG-motif cell wall-anchored protein